MSHEVLCGWNVNRRRFCRHRQRSIKNHLTILKASRQAGLFVAYQVRYSYTTAPDSHPGDVNGRTLDVFLPPV